jgi:hypothetical protein
MIEAHQYKPLSANVW